MSVQKLERVKAARKAQGKCTNCGNEINPGDPYLYWYPGFRAKHKIVRCDRPLCFPKPSERETSKAATILAATENFYEEIDGLETKEDIEQAVESVAEAVGEVRDEYQEALDSWENGNEQLQEKVDHYEDIASRVEGWSYDGADEPEPCSEHEETDDDCEICAQKRDEWLEEIRNAAREAVDEVETI